MLNFDSMEFSILHQLADQFDRTARSTLLQESLGFNNTPEFRGALRYLERLGYLIRYSGAFGPSVELTDAGYACASDTFYQMIN